MFSNLPDLATAELRIESLVSGELGSSHRDGYGVVIVGGFGDGDVV